MSTPSAPNPSQGERGLLIVFEGLDRSGKSTHAKHIAKVLNEKFNIPTQFTAFPNRETETGKKINDFLQNKLDLSDKEIHQLFLSNRFECQDELRKKLLQGTTLIVDRYSYSGACFSAAKELPDMDLKWCFEGEIGLPAPDVVIYMNVSPEIAEKRGGYGEERYEKKDFQARVRSQFENVINLSPSWGIYEEVAKEQLNTMMKNIIHGDDCKDDCKTAAHGDGLDNSKRVINSATKFITPWYKISSDGEFEDVAKSVEFAVLQVIGLKKSFPIENISQFPELENPQELTKFW
jgi:dTMP kinase